LAALYAVHAQPVLNDGDTGLGMSPAHQVALADLETLAAQVDYAANTLCHLMQLLIGQGWQGVDFWRSEQGRYSDKLLRIVAHGLVSPEATLPGTQRGARLEYSDYDGLRQAYLDQIMLEMQQTGLPANQTFLEPALRAFTEQLPSHYQRFAYQREALIELVRLWQGWQTRSQAIAQLHKDDSAIADDLTLDSALLRFLQYALGQYRAYPQQREALLRLVQGWQQLPTRSATLMALQQAVLPSFDLGLLDAALIDFVQRLPQQYQRQGEQRNALVEGFRCWQQLSSRPAALVALGVDAELFTGADPNPTQIANAALQTDRALMEFVQRLPCLYQATSQQRSALLQLAQLWHNWPSLDDTRQTLLNAMQQQATARRDRPDGLVPPIACPARLSPTQWTVSTLQLDSPIRPHSSFTWAMATQGGLALPPNQAIVEAMVTMAEHLQPVRDRLARPITIVRWYDPHPEMVEGQWDAGRFEGDRHALGDAVLFFAEGLSGRQLYWFLDPWWDGGLGWSAQFPYLCYVDLRGDRARWRVEGRV
jgi:hypothetical protein